MRLGSMFVLMLALYSQTRAQTCDVSLKSSLVSGYFSAEEKAYGASRTEPSLFQVRASSFEIHVSLPEVSTRSSARIEISRSSDSEVIVCASDWISAREFYIKVQTEKTGSWIVRVFKNGLPEPNADQPYAPVLSFGADANPVILQKKPGPWQMIKGPYGTCVPTEKPLNSGSILEQVFQDSSPIVSTGLLIERYRFAGGRLVYISISPKNLPTGQHFPIVIRAYAKDNRESSFSLACEHPLPASINGRFTLALGIPENVEFEPIWMIEITCRDACPAGRVPISVDIRREKNPILPAEASSSKSLAHFAVTRLTTRTFEYFCYGDRESRADIPLNSRDRFAGTTQLRIKIFGAHLSGTTLRALESYFLTAVSLWRRACLDCVADHLSVIRLDGKLFLDSDLVKWLFSLNPSEISPVDKHSMSEPGNIFFFFNGIVGGRRAGSRGVESPSYTEIVSEETRWRSLCGVPASYLPDSVLRIQQALPCGSADNEESTLAVELKLQQDGLSCGNSPNIIACEELGANVELNTRDFRFTTLRSLAPVVGRGPVRVDLMQILLHEIGHWIGLGHSQSSSGDIMDEYYEAGRCIENSSVEALQRMIARRQRSRDAGPSALKFGRENLHAH